MDTSGAVLFAKYPKARLAPASTVKLVTAMVAIDNLKTEDVVKVSTHASQVRTIPPGICPEEELAAGIRARGLRGYLLGYFRPNPLMAPLHVISELSRTLALAVRLFGIIMSGHLVVALMVALTGFLVPMPLMALDVLIGLLQAYIFAILATVYVGAALRATEP